MSNIENIEVSFSRQLSASDENKYKSPTIQISTKLYSHSKDQRPYFSVTGCIGPSYSIKACGCLHHEIMGAAPEIAPLIALHLSDYLGVPMYAQQNGWYFLAGALGGVGEKYHGGNSKIQQWKTGQVFDGFRFSTPDECLQTFANHCRLSIEDAKIVADDVSSAPDQLDWKKRWAIQCESMKVRWALEAREGIALLKSINY